MRTIGEFGPEELIEIGVAFENSCAAIPEAESQSFRERLALQLLGWAAAGTCESTQLYVRALAAHRLLGDQALCRTTPGVQP